MRFMRMTSFAAAAAVASLAPSIARAQNASAVVDRAISAWSKVRSLRGTFEQTIRNPLVGNAMKSRGEFRQQQPNKLAVRFTDPAGDAIVSDGKFMWIYLQQAAPGQVLKRPASDAMALPIDAGQFLASPKAKYDIAPKGPDKVGDRPAQVLTLTPKKGTDAPFTTATVWVDDADGMIRQFEVTEESGLVRRIRMLTVELNPTLTASDFTFVVPKGVKVIER
jgi:outer membrane lipoprotein carrier protein